MCSSLLHLAPGSRNLSQAEKRITTNYGRPERKSPSLNGRKSTPTTKFLGTAKAYFVNLLSYSPDHVIQEPSEAN